MAARTLTPRPIRRAAALDGLVPETDPAGLRAMIEAVSAIRGNLDQLDVVSAGSQGDDPSPFFEAGATWLLTALPEVCTLVQALRIANSGPPRSRN